MAKPGSKKKKQQQGNKKPYVDGRFLRRLAETAQGYPDTDLALLVENDKLTIKRLTAANRAKSICTVRTKSEVPNRESPESVKLKIRGGAELELTKEYDAVFWREASMEKFVLDYYRRLMSRHDYALFEQAIMTQGDFEIIAILHTWPSRPSTVTSIPDDIDVAFTGPNLVPQIVSLSEFFAKL